MGGGVVVGSGEGVGEGERVGEGVGEGAAVPSEEGTGVGAGSSDVSSSSSSSSSSSFSSSTSLSGLATAVASMDIIVSDTSLVSVISEASDEEIADASDVSSVVVLLVLPSVSTLVSVIRSGTVAFMSAIAAFLRDVSRKMKNANNNAAAMETTPAVAMKGRYVFLKARRNSRILLNLYSGFMSVALRIIFLYLPGNSSFTISPNA